MRKNMRWKRKYKAKSGKQIDFSFPWTRDDQSSFLTEINNAWRRAVGGISVPVGPATGLRIIQYMQPPGQPV